MHILPSMLTHVYSQIIKEGFLTIGDEVVYAYNDSRDDRD